MWKNLCSQKNQQKNRFVTKSVTVAFFEGTWNGFGHFGHFFLSIFEKSIQESQQFCHSHWLFFFFNPCIFLHLFSSRLLASLKKTENQCAGLRGLVTWPGPKIEREKNWKGKKLKGKKIEREKIEREKLKGKKLKGKNWKGF